MSKIIGTVAGQSVRFDESAGTVRIVGTSIMLVGARNEEEAVEIATRNLVNFERRERA